MVADVLLMTLGHVWRTLEASGTKMAVMGGIALASWKYVRATRDVDLLIALEGRSVDDLLEQLRAAGVRPRRQPPVVNLGRLRLIQCLYEPPDKFLDLQIDLLLAECPYQLEALDRRVPEQLAGLGISLFILTCEDLILHKLLAGRMIDRVDCIALIRLQREQLDWSYLQNWSGYLSVGQDLQEMWQEAFPGEPMPGNR
jgi:hypothetical protein